MPQVNRLAARAEEATVPIRAELDKAKTFGDWCAIINRHPRHAGWFLSKKREIGPSDWTVVLEECQQARVASLKTNLTSILQSTQVRDPFRETVGGRPYDLDDVLLSQKTRCRVEKTRW